MPKKPRIVIVVTPQQRAAIDRARGGVSLAQWVRDAVGARVEAQGIDWPPDPQVGGDRSKAE